MSAVNGSAGNATAAARGFGGVIVPMIFGFIFLLADAGALPTRWQLAVRIFAIAAGVLLSRGVAVTRRRERTSHSGAKAQKAPISRQFWLSCAAEVIAILAGIAIINRTGRHALTMTWIVLVVGVHFFGLVGLWNRGPFYAIVGLVITALGVLGFVLYAVGVTGAAVSAVPGIGAGLALYAAAGVTLLRRSRTLRAHPADRMGHEVRVHVGQRGCLGQEGRVCKTVGSAYDGSNPSPATT